MKQTLEVAGQLFDSIQDAARHYGVRERTVAWRLRSGWTPEQALGVAPKPPRDAHNAHHLMTSRGEFPSVRSLAEAAGIEEGTLALRLRLGWTVDQAAGFVARPQRSRGREYKVIECQGRTFLSWTEFARAFGLSSQLVSKRLRSGWTPEQAAELESAPPRFRRFDGSPRNHLWREPTRLEGRLVPGAPAGCFRLYLVRNKQNRLEYVGITTSDLRARWRGHLRMAKIGRKSKFYNAIRKYGARSFEISLIRDDARDFVELQAQELEEIKRRGTVARGYNTAAGGSLGTSTAVTIAGVAYPSRAAAAAHFNVEVGVFNTRLVSLGWSPEEAAGLVPRAGLRPRIITVGGKRYRSVKAACEALGLSYKAIHQRLRRQNATAAEEISTVIRGALANIEASR